jgi:EAL domain-containing protein (putative c-di-GMP-specific phosphodiesterase class I)
VAAATHEQAVASLLARPDSVRSVQQPIVSLESGVCSGYSAVVRIAEWVGRESGPWFEAAADAGLTGPLAGLALQSCLRARATMPGDRFLVAEISGRVLTTAPVMSVLDGEDDVADIMLMLTGDPGPGSGPILHDLRGRGLRFVASCGLAGLDDLEALTAWGPEVLRLPSRLVRGLAEDPVRQRLVALVVDLADELSQGSGGVIADEVETLAEISALRDLGVRWAQGWLLGRHRAGFAPPAIDLQDWISGLGPPLRSDDTGSLPRADGSAAVLSYP